MIYGKVIKKHPQTQEDVDDWLKVGKQIIRRKLRHVQPDDGSVIEAIMNVGRSLDNSATDDDFTLRVRHSFVWYWNRLNRSEQGFETRRIFRDIPFITDYLKEHKTDSVDSEKLYKYIRKRGYSVSRSAVEAYLTVNSRELTDDNGGILQLASTQDDTPNTEVDESTIRSCIQLYIQLYGETPGVRRICKTFYTDVPNDSYERRYAIPFVEHLLTFMRHQFGEQTFDGLRQVMLHSYYKPENSYKEVFHV